MRARYRAKKKDPFHRTRLEYVNNLLASDYVVCMRGAGNFSVRFYEALSLGKIPVFIDSDCILPYDFAVHYRDYCVWVPYEERHGAARIVAQFHARLSPAEFTARQEQCRALWVNRLSRDGFYSHFREHLEQSQRVGAEREESV